MQSTTVQQYQIKLSPSQWAIASAARQEAGRLYTKCVKVHRRCRKYHKPWPTESQLEKHYKGRFNLHSQTIQAVIQKFCANIETTRTNRKNGLKANYPWKEKRYFNPIWKGQAVRLKGRRLTLPMGKNRSPLTIKLPSAPVGKIVQVELGYNVVYLTLATNLSTQPNLFPQTAAGDLGVCNLIAVTDGSESLIISGRGLRSIRQQLAKGLAQLTSRIDRCKKGSRKRKKLVRAKHKLRRKVENQTRNLLHHAANEVTDWVKAHDITTLAVGDLADLNKGTKGKRSKRSNQDIGFWPHGQFTNYLKYKLDQEAIGLTKDSEAYTSQTCPACLNKYKPQGRNYRCRKCGFTAPRDEVGAYNFLNKTTNGSIMANTHLPTGRIKYLQPVALKRPRAVDAADTSPAVVKTAASRSFGLAVGHTVHRGAFAPVPLAVASN